MFGQISNLKITSVVTGTSSLQAKRVNRPSHMLYYKINGESIYYLRGKEVKLTPGTILYVPQGESYSIKKISEGDSLFRVVNFQMTTSVPLAPELFTLPQNENVDTLFKQMDLHWRLSDDPGEKFETLSLFYHLLSLLMRTQRSGYTTMRQKSRIDSAGKFLENHIYDCDLKVSALSELCNMSEATFRHIFFTRFEMSPKKYIIRQRMLKARAILESGEYKNIAELAHSVGYDDPLYFSKHFKSFYSFSPSQYRP